MSQYHKLYTPQDSAVVFIDHQPQMLFGVASIDRATLINNVTLLAKVAKEFNVPAVLTAVETESFSGYVWPQLLDVFPGQPVVERSSMNSWDDAGFRKAIEATGRKNILMTGLWTEVCVTWPTIEMLGAGYNIYVVEDCCGATSPAAQEAALSRMVQAGAVRLTTIAALLEWQRDWKKRSITTRSWACSKARAALTAWASNTPTRWFTTHRSRREAAGRAEEGGPLTPVIEMGDPIHIAITRRVRKERVADFERALADFASRSLAEPGTRGVHCLHPPPGSDSREYGIMRSFASAEDRQAFYEILYLQGLARADRADG